jgi:DNA-binding NarL/FixJ family response regulator
MELIKLVIAEANVLLREGLKRVLAPESDLLVVGEAADETQVVEVVERTKADVLLLDLAISKRGAVPVLLDLKQKNLAAKVFILSLFPDDESILDSAKAGARGCVLKNILPSNLIQAIRKIHRGEIWVDKQLTCAETFAEFAGQTEDAEKLENKITRVLSKRELEILALVARGLTNQQISRALFISLRTVKAHVNHILHKLNVTNRIQAALLMLQHCGELVKQVGTEYEKRGAGDPMDKSKKPRKSGSSSDDEADNSPHPSQQLHYPRRRSRYA